MNGNPLNIGPNWPGNYIQPGTGNPTPPANQPAIASFATGQNNLAYPLPEIENARTPLDNHSAGGVFPAGVFPHLTS